MEHAAGNPVRDTFERSPDFVMVVRHERLVQPVVIDDLELALGGDSDAPAHACQSAAALWSFTRAPTAVTEIAVATKQVPPKISPIQTLLDHPISRLTPEGVAWSQVDHDSAPRAIVAHENPIVSHETRL